MSGFATLPEAVAFVREHGVVLVSARGPAPRLTEAILGEPIRGSWWAHPRGHALFSLLSAVTESEDILVCRLLGGKVTLVHRRFWPALVRLAALFSPSQLARVREEHTASGRHVRREEPFPQWVPTEVEEQARGLSEPDALAIFGAWVGSSKSVRP